MNIGEPFTEGENSYQDQRTLFKLRDPEKPWKRNSKGERRGVDYSERIQIYDVFGFFQQSLTGAIGDMPDVVSPDELTTIKSWKEHRGEFKPDEIEGISQYTSLELRALVNMMNKLRQSLADAIPGRPIKLPNWFGAGSIAKALLDMYLGADAKQILGNVEEDTIQRTWGFHSYFGGRVELAQQGRTNKPVYELDVASAYPAQAVKLPSMKGGRWEHVINPTREQVENASILSMFHVAIKRVRTDLPFYPLPYRVEGSLSIIYPPEPTGYYMRDHVIGALKWFDEFERRKRLCHYGINPDGAKFHLLEAWLFHPATDERPLAFVKELFDYRASLPKSDVRGTVIKLGINSVYGKLAQRIGRKGKPSKFASPWYAAAITAGTQRQLVEAALTDPDAVVAMATDGIYSTRPLEVEIPEKKELGKWETDTFKGGGAAIQSGVGTWHKDNKAEKEKDRFKVKSRGFNPRNLVRQGEESYASALDRELYENIPKLMSEGKETYSFPSYEYMNLGRATVSKKTWEKVGMWKTGPRELQLDKMSRKRRVPNNERLKKARGNRFVPLEVQDFIDTTKLSAMSVPQWLSDANRRAREADEDDDNVMAGMS